MKRRARALMLLVAVLLLSVYAALRLRQSGSSQLFAWDVAFAVEAQGREIRLKLWHNQYDGRAYLFLPSFCDETATARIDVPGYQDVTWDGQTLAGGAAVGELTDGEHFLQVGGAQFAVTVMHSSCVPALFVTTQSGSLTYIEEEKGNGEPGLYEIIGQDGTVKAAGQIKKLKSRGNATFLEDKKPYQMTLVDAADLLGTGDREKYILLANRQDQSLLRDRILYDLAGDIGLAYSPVSAFLDLYVNGEYRGSYQLSEKVETGRGGIAVDTDTGREETGFLVTLEYAYEDRLADAEYYFTTKNSQNVVVKRPQDPTDVQMSYIAGVFQDIEDDIRSGKIDETKIDVTSFAKKYLMEEIGKNLDAMYTSQYFYRDAAADGTECRLYAGPVWDYDKTLGNPLIENTRPVNFQEPRGIFAATKQKDASWWYDLYRIPAFRERVIEEYRDCAAPAVSVMLEEKIDGYRDEIWDSAYMDYIRWDTFEDFKYGEAPAFEEEYEAEVERIKGFLRLRMEFLDDIWLEGRTYDKITCDPGEGVMYVTQIDAVEGRTINEPRDPKLEGYRFDHWVRKEDGERYDFTEVYDGVPFTLLAVYEKEE